MTKQQHTLTFSREGMIKSLGDQFTSRWTVLSEALQNARRSGATRIDICFIEKSRILKIQDNGTSGFDFKKYFKIGKSGWDDLTKIVDNPYGIGAVSSFYAAHVVEIFSGNQYVYIDSNSLLAGEQVEIEDNTPTDGTILQLQLNDRYKKEDTESIQSTINIMVKGFPVPVFFNGKEIERPHALDSESYTFEDTRAGKLYLPSASNSNYPLLYLQGLPVEGFRAIHSWERNRPILHLDSQQYRARVPDRDKLIDSENFKKAIDESVAAARRERLVALREELTPEQFSEKYWTDCMDLGVPKLLKGCPVYKREYYKLDPDVYKGDIGNERAYGQGGLAEGMFCIDSDSWEYTANEASAYVATQDYIVMSGSVPKGYDLKPAVIEAKAAPIGKQVESSFCGNRNFSVTICDAIELTAWCIEGDTKRKLPTIQIKDEVVVEQLDEYGEDFMLYVPRHMVKANRFFGDAAIDRMYSYLDENEYYQEREHDEDARELESLLVTMVTNDASAIVRTLISNPYGGTANMVAKRKFTITFDDRGNVQVKQKRSLFDRFRISLAA